MPRTGRPSTFTPEIGERIVDLYAAGVRLDEICRDYDWAPDNHVSIFRWSQRYPDFGVALSRARRWHAESLAMKTMGVVAQIADPARARAQIQSMQWAASKYAPQVFGEKLEITADTRVSLVDAINAGRTRLLPERDQGEDDQGQAPVMIDVSPNASTDQTSEAADEELPDFFD